MYLERSVGTLQCDVIGGERQGVFSLDVDPEQAPAFLL
jgi:hypothetical protein